MVVRKHGKWIAGLLVALVVLGSRAAADPVHGMLFTFTQPDGTEVQVRVWGDEFHSVVETLDGFTVVQDPATGACCYAELSADGDELISTGILAGDGRGVPRDLEPHLRVNPEASAAAARAARADFYSRGVEEMGPAFESEGPWEGPTTGNVAGICLLIDFSDCPATIAANEVDKFCNQNGYTGNGNNGSVRDYFYDVSDGNLTYTNHVPTAYYRATYPKTYYDDPNLPAGERARELILEALNSLEAGGFDFSLYDADHNGIVDALNCFYAGTRAGPWARGLWPHAWTVSFTADGVSTYRYQISDMGSFLTLGTFCHENGHMLMGWPDLYDYGYESNGVGKFCIMCYYTSATNPNEPCAYLKDIAGWATTTGLGTSTTGLSVPSGVNTIYKFPHPTSTNEYYLIENRQKTGRDAGLPDAGLAIWHIDKLGDNDLEAMTPSSHYLVTLVQADGQWDLEHGLDYGDTTDLWKAPTYTRCSPFSTPDTSWWDGTASELDVYDISASGATMTFSFARAVDCNNNGIADDVDIVSGSSDCNSNGIPDECETGLLPSVTSQPTAQTACTGGTAVFSVVATGAAPLSYQWYKDGVAIAGATGTSLTLAGVTTADAGGYDVEVSNSCNSTTSNRVSLVVHGTPTIAQQPESKSANTGNTVTLSVAAAGATPLTYQWWRDGVIISGATSAIYTITDARIEDSGNYSVVIDSPCGWTASAVAALSVSLSPVISPTPSNGSSNISLLAKLTWGAVAGAEAYDVYFGTEASPPYVGQTITPSWVPGELAYNTTYHWKVTARDGAITTDGPIWYFTCAAPPVAPGTVSLPNPPDGAVNVALEVVPTWAAADGATSYSLVLSTQEVVVDGYLVGQTMAVVGSRLLRLSPGTTYAWQVLAANASGVTPGPVWTFTTVDAVQVLVDGDNVTVDGGTQPVTTPELADETTDPIAASGMCPTAAAVIVLLTLVGLRATRGRG